MAKTNNKHYLELYKICIHEAAAISERRMKNNHHFILLHCAIITAIFGLVQNIHFSYFYFFVLLGGLDLCRIWQASIGSYKRLNDAKYKVILRLEKKLAYPCFQKEWELLQNDKDYKILSFNEKDIPLLFQFMYYALFLYLSYSALSYIS